MATLLSTEPIQIYFGRDDVLSLPRRASVRLTVFAHLHQNEVADRLTDDLIALTSIPALPEGTVVLYPRSLDRLDLAKFKAGVKYRTPDVDSAMQKFAGERWRL